jgi:tryptophan-rich sensory protein
MNSIASKAQLRMSFLRVALVTVPLVLLLGLLSGRVANSGYGNPWFDALAKPELMPPGWTFGVVWTLLYILLGLALAMILHARGSRGRGPAVALFGLQLLLNYAWSPAFFAAHKVTLALGMIVAILLISIVTALLFARIRKGAALLMLPYLAWLGFASYLNYEILRLNPDAESLAPGNRGPDIQFDI